MHRFARTAVVSSALTLLALPSPSLSQTLESTLTASDAAFGDTIGHTIALDGDTVVIGARAESDNLGAAYVFRRAAGGVWSEEAKLADAAAATGAQLGFSVSISGDAVAAGAPEPFNPFTPASGPGSVYVFRRSGASWSQEAQFTSADGQSNDQFGFSVAIDGSRAAIGARGDEPAGAGLRYDGQGSAYIFEEAAGVWTEDEKIVAADGVGGDRFGSAIALEGDFVVIGAPGDDDLGMDSGSAYVFRRQGANWVQDAKLVASDGTAGDEFGTAVSISGDAIAVGAYLKDGAGADAGAVYIFRDNGAAWVQEAKITASDAAADAFFGFSVSLSGDKLAVGAEGAEAVYRYSHAAGIWTEDGKLTQAGTALLGHSVARSFDFVAAGAPLTTAAGVPFSGAGYVWCDNPGPVLLSVNPTEGIFSQSTPVTLTGANFSPFKLTSVTFGGNLAANVTVVSESEITCDAPPGTQGATVDVVVNHGADSATLLGAFTYVGTDLVSISPTSGPFGGGTAVTLTGTNFATDGSTTVSFGGNAAAVTSVTSTSIQCTSPAGTPGAVVSVTVSGNNGTDTLTNAFTYTGIDLVSVSPASGPAGGGTAVTLTGVNFATDGSTAVTFGGTPAAVTSVTSTSIACTAPAGVPGSSVDVTVTDSNGSDTLPGAFAYIGTDLVSVSPTSGPSAGGNVVTLTGTLFATDGSTTVTFGGNAAAINSVTSTQIQCVAPAGARGSTVDVTVNGSNGSDTLAGAYSYDQVSIVSISPQAANFAAGATVTVSVVNGTSLADTSITLGGSAVTVTAADATSATFSAPAVAAPTGAALDVTITNSNGSDTLAGAFTYTPALSAQVSGDVASGGTVTVTWTVDPAAPPAQVVTLWLADPLMPPLDLALPGFANTLQAFPMFFLVKEGSPLASPLALAFGPLPPELAGFGFSLQLLASDEGDVNGSFSNVANFSIP